MQIRGFMATIDIIFAWFISVTVTVIWKKKYCPARILSFVHFTTKDFPTPDGHDSVYAVIHTALHYLSWEKLDREFICTFTLGDIKTCVYIFDVRTITNPLFVCRNYGKSGNQYLCTLPYRHWGNYFQHRLR